MEVDVQYTTAVAVSNRYAELIRLKEEKASKKKRHKPTRGLRTQIPTNGLCLINAKTPSFAAFITADAEYAAEYAKDRLLVGFANPALNDCGLKLACAEPHGGSGPG
jgi:hypothetical protein